MGSIRFFLLLLGGGALIHYVGRMSYDQEFVIDSLYLLALSSAFEVLDLRKRIDELQSKMRD